MHKYDRAAAKWLEGRVASAKPCTLGDDEGWRRDKAGGN